MNFNNAEFDRAFGISAQLPASDKAEIVFAGRSNVGKSSLLNRLFGRKNLARVSSVPGKTITINFYTVDGYRFVDLPGYGYAKISKAEKDRFATLSWVGKSVLFFPLVPSGEHSLFSIRGAAGLPPRMLEGLIDRNQYR